MKATGIVRRVDDLGRVIIPKELRRTLKIREGDPLEIFIDNGCVVFKKYNAVESRDWITARNIAHDILCCDFALLNRYSELMIKCGTTLNLDDIELINNDVRELRVQGELIGYLVTNKEHGHVFMKDIAQKALQSFLAPMCD
jgi:AbrB family looped-hinge helix DNA binding protein